MTKTREFGGWGNEITPSRSRTITPCLFRFLMIYVADSRYNRAIYQRKDMVERKVKEWRL